MPLPFPINVKLDIYRNFSATSPYPSTATPPVASGVRGHLTPNVIQGKFGYNARPQWTHTLYVPADTDIRSAYDTQLNAWLVSAGDTITVKDYPRAGFCTAFLVVMVQLYKRDEARECLRVYLDRLRPRQGDCQVTGCCPEPLPNVIHATVLDTAGCPCIDGEVVELNYQPVTHSWEGFKDVCGGPHTITLGFSCGLTNCTQATLTGSFGGYNFPSATVDPGCSCNPLQMSFSGIRFNAFAAVCANATVQIVITL